MKLHKKIIIVLASTLLGTLSLNAQAACSISNIAGTWRIFAVTGSPSFQGWGRGTLVFSSKGALVTKSSSFVLSTGTTIRFSRGQGQITSTCRTTGSLVSTIGITLTLVDGQMNTSKNVVSGVYKRSDGDVGLINFIK